MLHFNYDLQVWVKDGIIQDCNHPETMKSSGCCFAHKVEGKMEARVLVELDHYNQTT